MRKHFFFLQWKLFENNILKRRHLFIKSLITSLRIRSLNDLIVLIYFVFVRAKNSWICTNIQAEIFYSNLDEYFWLEQVESFRKWRFFYYIFHHICCHFYYYFKFDVKVTQFWKHLSVRHEIIISVQPWFTYTNTFWFAIPILIHTRCNLMVK